MEEYKKQIEVAAIEFLGMKYKIHESQWLTMPMEDILKIREVDLNSLASISAVKHILSKYINEKVLTDEKTGL